MKIALVHPLLFGVTSTRLLQNLSKGLKKHGFEVAFISLYASNKNMKSLSRLGKIYTFKILKDMPKKFVIKDWIFNDISKRLFYLLEKNRDELKDSVGILTTSAFGGDLSMIRSKEKGIFVSIGWFYDNPPGILDFSSKIVRMGKAKTENFALNLLSSLSPLLLKRFWRAQDFDFLIASTKWVANALNYVTGCEVEGVIYPPVDVDIFKPTPLEKPLFGDKWCFSIGRKNEIKFQDIKNLAKKINIVKSGKEMVDGVKNIGHTTTKQLVSLYSSAYFTLFPTLLEPAGYIPLESMACGTPVLTYAWQGPGETVIDNKTGWIAHTRKEFYELGIKLWENGYDSTMRKKCRDHVINNFSVEISSKKLSKIIRKYT